MCTCDAVVGSKNKTLPTGTKYCCCWIHKAAGFGHGIMFTLCQGLCVPQLGRGILCSRGIRQSVVNRRFRCRGTVSCVRFSGWFGLCLFSRDCWRFTLPTLSTGPPNWGIWCIPLPEPPGEKPRIRQACEQHRGCSTARGNPQGEGIIWSCLLSRTLQITYLL